MRTTRPGALRVIAVFIALGSLSLAASLVMDMRGNGLVNAYRVLALLVFARSAELFWRRDGRNGKDPRHPSG